MVIVNLTGQLGNQMFQYAIGRKNQLLGHDVRYNLSYYNGYPTHWSLWRFGLELPKATIKEVLKLKDEYSSLPDRVRRKLFGRHPRVVSEISRNEYFYDPSVFQYKNVFIDGYWQSEKYFLDIADVLKSDFAFPQSDNPKNLILADELNKYESVSIHVRRGDYLGGFPVMDMNYFAPAMKYFRNKYENVRFYVFSNDIQWCKENIVAADVFYVDWNSASDGIFDMQLMSLCKHNIIANSTFSWWGAWLNQNSDKEVIAPKIWFEHAKTPHIYCENWKII